MIIRKFDVVRVNLYPEKGSVPTGIRPCVVVQNNIFNTHSPTIIVVPLTTNKAKLFPGEFLIKPSNLNGLTKESRFLGHQLITVDKIFIYEQQGQLEDKYYSEVQYSLDIVLGRK